MKVLNKKSISLRSGELIDKLTKDASLITGKTESAIMEDAILAELLPKDENYKAFAAKILYNDDGGIGNTLSSIFKLNAAGINWNAQHDNLLPIVEFAKHEEAMCWSCVNGEANMTIHHCLTQLDSIIERLSKEADAETDYLIKGEKTSRVAYAKEMRQELQDEPNSLNIVNLYQIVLDDWESLKNWARTFRFLGDLADMENRWHTDSENRYQLLQLMIKVSKEWEKAVM